MKDDKPLKIFKAVVYITAGAAMAFVFVKNMFPTNGEAFVISGGISYSSTVQLPSVSDETDGSAYISNSSVTYSSCESSMETSSDTPSSVQSSSSSVLSADNVGSAPQEQQTSPNEPPAMSAGLQTSSTVPQSSTNPEQIEGKININTASVSELQKLSGIGEVKAFAIIEYREQNGYFTSVDELVNVKGIGEKTLEKFRDMITV